MKKDDVLSEWNEKEEKVDKKVARKLVWKTRLSITYTVVRTLFAIFLLYLLYMIPVGVYYEMSGKGTEFDRLVTTLVETRHPGIAVDKRMHHAEISPLLTQSTSGKLYRNVGEWEVVIGEVTAKKAVFGKIQYSLDFNDKYLGENEEGFEYTLAPDLIDEPAFNEGTETYNDIGDQLEMIGDGFVAQAQFSTMTGMDPENLRKMLESYDVMIQQMPVFAGELTEVDVNWSGSGQFKQVDSLMLRPFIEYDDDSRGYSWYESLTDKVSLNDAVNQFYKDLEWLIDNGNYYDKEIDEKRLAYLKENELKVYGATVTGPIREIERLQEEEMFHQFHLGGIEVWNWTVK